MEKQEQTFKSFRPAAAIASTTTIFPEPTTKASAEIDDAEVASRWRSVQYLRKRRCVLCCCGLCGVTVVFLGLAVLILAFVFKIKDPEMTMNSIWIDKVDVGFGSLDHPVSVNATLTADISLKNPNAAALEYDNSTTGFYTNGVLVGVAYTPNGKVSGDRTVRMNVTVDVLTDRVAAQRNLTDNILSDVLNLTSYTGITGLVSVLGIYKHNVDIMLNCTMTLNVILGQQEIKNKVCQGSTK